MTGAPWPPIPRRLLDLWDAVSGWPHPPEACLVNFYSDDAKMGLHRTATSRNLPRRSSRFRSATTACSASAAPGADDRTLSFRLRSGDVVVLGGEGRLAFHGVDRIYPMTSTLLKNGGRINLTLRRVNPG